MAIFQKLTAGPMAVHELAGMLPVSRPAVSQHLRVLKSAGLVIDSPMGTRRVYQLDPEGIARLRAHFDQVWDKAMSGFEGAAKKQHHASNAAPLSTQSAAKARQAAPKSIKSPKTGGEHGKARRRTRRT